MKTMFLANQLAAFDQVRDVRAEIDAELYQPVMAEIEKNGNFEKAKWCATVDPLVVELTAAFVVRTRAERMESGEADQLALDVKAALKWIREARVVTNQAVRLKKPGAADLATELTETPDASQRQVGMELRVILAALDDVADLVALGFTIDFRARGAVLLAALDTNRTEEVHARAGITVGTDDIHRLLAALLEQMEILNDAREVAQVRLERELPGFDLRLIRAAAAGFGSAPAEAAPPAPDLTQNGL